ncbi:glycerate kinase [Paenibacillus planticolens]|uniref:Glycerate kinase n=1 Tax=Paenibacillus planticolens TaxID=2654976 RepID=A0ABX1ZJH6_9BACL|nr:glycerate kinase [Paenibacillus planticolens]NOU99802.1 glycerate kinase [Paenibacillus planticolens]
MKIVVAPDSFKGSLTASGAGEAMRQGILKASLHHEIVVIPMADGGEGSVRCLVDATGGQLFATTVENSTGKPIEATYGVLGDGATCVIELAAACGLYVIEKSERNPLFTSTYGFGQLITAGLERGYRRFVLCLGGSGTNDGGAGMLEALGAKLLDANGHLIQRGAIGLSDLHAIDTASMDPRIYACDIQIACDVTNPLVGSLGASYVFGPQKGADTAAVELLEVLMKKWADHLEQMSSIPVRSAAGAGAGGGTAAGILALLQGRIRAGSSLIAEISELERHVQGADLVLTGEGKVDSQTAHGKTPSGVAFIAKKHGVPTIIIAGTVGSNIENLYTQGVCSVLSLLNKPMSLDEALENAAAMLENTTEAAVRLFAAGSANKNH